jgi:hypothetical protein
MKTIVVEGAGILSGVHEIPSDEEWAKQKEIERAEEAAARARLEQHQATLDRLDALIAPHVKNEMAEVKAAATLSDEEKKDFGRFRTYVEQQWNLSALPASPQALAVFLVRESADHGLARAIRAARHISQVHSAVGFDDPADDLLVKALLKLFRRRMKEAKISKLEQKGIHHNDQQV